MPFSKWINKLQPIQIMEYYSVLQFSAFIKTLFVQLFHRVFLDFPNHLHLIPLTTTPLPCWWYSYLSFLLVLRSLRSQHLGHLFGSHKAIVWPLWGVVSTTKWEVPRELLSATLTILLPNNGTVWFCTCLWPMAKVIQLGLPILCVSTWKKAPHSPHHERQAFTGFCNCSNNLKPVVLFFFAFSLFFLFWFH